MCRQTLNIAIMKDPDSTLEQVARLSREATDKESEFLRYILLAASGMLGILISLHSASPECLYSRWAFLLSVLSLALAILLGSLVLYDLSKLARRAQEMLSEEYAAAIREHRPQKPIFLTHARYYAFCEIATYILLLLSLVLLCAYAVCNTFRV